MILIWSVFILTTSLVAYGSFSRWNIFLIAGLGIITNLLWAYLTTIVLDKELLIKYAVGWDTIYVILFAIVPVVFVNVQTTPFFWIGLLLIILGIFVLHF